MSSNSPSVARPNRSSPNGAAAHSHTDPLITVRDIGKMYRIYDRPQDRLKQMLLWRFGRSFGQEFWALRGVSFEIDRGETVGVIGRNGGGKSTLLQLIAGTLAPTEGELIVQGRVAALLELGSGFNPEFTGRENVFMNGAILGLARAEMEARFADIVAFADIGEFIDQPVKLYSSGMALRLAFAVQVFVDKDLLIVDEALAVGDEAFQRKCLRALEQFRDAGGTVLLVSHSAQTIVRQCSRALFMHQGRLLLDGPSKYVTDVYQRFLYAPAAQQIEILARLARTEPVFDSLLEDAPPPEDATPGARPVELTEVAYGTRQAVIERPLLLDGSGHASNVFRSGEWCIWRYHVQFHATAYRVRFGMMLKLIDGLEVAGVNNEHLNEEVDLVPAGSQVTVSFHLRLNLTPGVYYLNAGVSGSMTPEGDNDVYLHRRVDVASLRIVPPDERQIYGIAYVEPTVKVIIQ